VTDSPVLTDERAKAPLVRRARLQRLVRRQRRHAARDAWIGAAVCALLVGVLHGGAVLLPGGWAGVADDLVSRGGLAHADTTEEAGEGAPARFSAAFVGDLMFARHVEEVAARRGYDALLAEVTPHLDADYVSGNLEQVVSERDDLPEADKLIHLASDARPLEALRDAGFTLLTLANNHAMDHGIPGLEDTIAALDAAGLDHVGAGLDLDEAAEIHYAEHDGLTVATVAFSDAYVVGFPARAFQGGVLAAEMDTIVRLIQQAAAEADLVVAQFHWGDEYDFGPNGRQRELAEAAAASGADLVVGHHPHVLMPVERIGDTLVFYSLGNFVFDQGWSRTRESAIARYELGDDGTARVELRPVYIREATPRPVEGWTGAYRRERIFSQLRGPGLDWRRDGDVLVAEVDHRHVLEGAR
jgi:gamma-polyglutamate biosynthesis protein CapA